MKIKSNILFLPLILALVIIYEFSYPINPELNDTVAAATEAGYIKWIDFTPTCEALSYSLKLDLSSCGTEYHTRMYELLAVYSAMNAGNYKKFKKSTLDAIIEKRKSGVELYDMVSNRKLLNYYLTAYEAVLGSFTGEYFTVDANGEIGEKPEYGLRVFSPIAKNYGYSHYDDFGASRSYGYKRRHLGHDLMGSIGTPIVAIEGGYVEACGWNQYGGWRIGIRSFDGKRYYYYAHLRKGHPYNDIYDGKTVNAGEVIGYLGMTGYSAKKDTNNIDTPHLHFGMQVIFDKSQKDGVNQIWIDMYSITDFLRIYRSAVKKSDDDYFSQTSYMYAETPD